MVPLNHFFNLKIPFFLKVKQRTGEVLHRYGQGKPFSILTIDSMKEEDRGQYKCEAVNVGGVESRSFFLEAGCKLDFVDFTLMFI